MKVNRPQPPATEPPKSMPVDTNNRVTETPAKPDKTQQPVAPPPKDNKDSVGHYPQSRGPVSSVTLCAVRHDGSTLGQPQKPQKPEVSPHHEKPHEKPRFDSGANIIHCAVRHDGSTLGQPRKPQKPEAPPQHEKPPFDAGSNIIHCAVRPDGSTLGQVHKPKPTKD